MNTNPPADTLMWEARARPGRQEELLDWVEQTAVPALLAAGACLGVSTYTGGQDRVVVIVHGTGAPPRLPDPPDDLLLRPVHQWPFRRHATHHGPAPVTPGG
ncbi:hypothetical protein [Actinomadura miaoliensis]|uniref:Uncharacterized protein n=1 Tax=Actinomadura miaoliensis TaxID=430685 RepID=A0ABP7W5V4_9ACTN